MQLEIFRIAASRCSCVRERHRCKCPRNRYPLWVAVALIAISPVSVRCQIPITLNRPGKITIDATLGGVQGCPVLGDNAKVFNGTMKGTLGKASVEIDVYPDAGLLNNTLYGCQSSYTVICTPTDNPLNLVILADVSSCEEVKLKPVPNSLIGAWQVSSLTDGGITTAWGAVTGIDANANSPQEQLKLTLKGTIQFGPS